MRPEGTMAARDYEQLPASLQDATHFLSRSLDLNPGLCSKVPSARHDGKATVKKSAVADFRAKIAFF